MGMFELVPESEQLPTPVGEPSLSQVLNEMVMLFQTTKKLPNHIALAQRFNTNAAVIQKILTNRDFTRAAKLRGLPIDQHGTLSEEQFRALAYVVSQPKGTLDQHLRKLGIPRMTWANWMQVPIFRDTMNAFAEEIMDSAYPDVVRGLVSAAGQGRVDAIKLHLEMTGRYDPNATSTKDIMAVVRGIIEVITKNVTDPVLLEKLSLGIQEEMHRAGLGVTQ